MRFRTNKSVDNLKEVDPEPGSFASRCTLQGQTDPGGWGVLPYMGYTGMCGPKGLGFSAVLVINRVSILAILVLNRVWF